MVTLDRLQLAKEPVVFGVAERGSIEHVVLVTGALELFTEGAGAGSEFFRHGGVQNDSASRGSRGRSHDELTTPRRAARSSRARGTLRCRTGRRDCAPFPWP